MGSALAETYLRVGAFLVAAGLVAYAMTAAGRWMRRWSDRTVTGHVTAAIGQPAPVEPDPPTVHPGMLAQVMYATQPEIRAAHQLAAQLVAAVDTTQER